MLEIVDGYREIRLTQWHYNAGGQQRGPISLDELKAKVVAGELSGTSLVWQVGTKDWSELRNFPELAGQFQTPPPLPKSVTFAKGTRSVGAGIADALPALGISLFVVGIFLAIAIPLSRESVGLIAISVLVGIGIAVALVIFFRPKQATAPPSYAWRRFFAKSLDVEIATLVGLVAVAIVSPETWRGFAVVFLFTSLSVWFLFEVPMKGKSLGRYLFGVQLSPAVDAEESPNFFDRFIRLSFFGMALGLPILSAITASFAYKRLRETGATQWDDGRFAVSYRKGVGLPLVGVFLLLVFAGVQGVLQAMAPKQAAPRSASKMESAISKNAPQAVPEASKQHSGVAVPGLQSNETPTIGYFRKKYPNLASLSDLEIAKIYADGEGISLEIAILELGIESRPDSTKSRGAASNGGSTAVAPNKQTPTQSGANSPPKKWCDARKLYPGWKDADILASIAADNGVDVDYVKGYLSYQGSCPSDG